MPDTFKLLAESFQDQPPAVEGDGFHDFNALSRIAPPQASVSESEDNRAGRSEMPGRPYHPVSAAAPVEAAPPGPRHPQSPLSQPVGPAPLPKRQEQGLAPSHFTEAERPADKASARSFFKPREMEASVMPEGRSIDESTGVAPSAQDVASSAWRQMPVSDLFARMRSAVPVKPTGQRRLHGMFRR